MSQAGNRKTHGSDWLAALGGPLLIVTALAAIIGLVSSADDDGKALADSQAAPVAQAARVDHDSPVWSLAFSAHDTYLASATVSGEVWVKNLASGQRTLVERGPMSSAQSVAFSPDGHILALARADGAVVLWSVAERRPLAPVAANERSLQSIGFSCDGRYFATGGNDGCLRLWDVAAAIPGTRKAPAEPGPSLTQLGHQATSRP